MVDLSGLVETLTHDMFFLAVPVAEKVLRPVVVYLFLVLLLRVFGKRELAQLNPFDLIVLLALSNTVQNAIIGEDNSVTGGIIGAFTLVALNYFMVRLVRSHRRIDELLEGEPTPLITNSQLCEHNLRHELISLADLQAIARRQGFGSLDEIESCYLEPNGTISIIGRKPSSDEARQRELIAAIELLRREVAELRQITRSAAEKNI